MARQVRRSVRSLPPTELTIAQGELFRIYRRFGYPSRAWVTMRAQIEVAAREHGHDWSARPKPRHEIEAAQAELSWIYRSAGPCTLAWQVLRAQIAFFARGGAERASWAVPHAHSIASGGGCAP